MDFGPKMPFIMLSFSATSYAERLTGVPADQHVERPELGAGERAHVTPPWHVRPMPLQHARRVIIDLHLPSAREACPL
jgi:hypothetical protein